MDKIKRSPLISVIVPCYNLGAYLEETLLSVITQSFTDWECILVDNGSTDNTKVICEKFITIDQRFAFYSIENNGVSFARNFGIKKSSGKYILPLDSDDKIGKDYMQLAVDHFKNYPNTTLIYSDAEFFGVAKGKWDLKPFSLKTILIENIIFCTAFFLRTDYDKTSGYNENMLLGFEDWDFWLSLLQVSSCVHKIPSVQFYYRIRTTSRNNSLTEQQIKSLRKTLYENHRDLYHANFEIPELIYENYSLSSLVNGFQTTAEYKTSRLLLMPFRFFRSILLSHKTFKR